MVTGTLQFHVERVHGHVYPWTATVRRGDESWGRTGFARNESLARALGERMVDAFEAAICLEQGHIARAGRDYRFQPAGSLRRLRIQLEALERHHAAAVPNRVLASMNVIVALMRMVDVDDHDAWPFGEFEVVMRPDGRFGAQAVRS